MPAEVTLDGELLVLRDGEVASFNDLQQRLNRKTPNPKLLRDYPAAVRLYDILREGGEDLRGLSFAERRRRLEAWYAREPRPGLDLSPLVPFTSWDELRELRDGARERGIEGLMLKRADSLYVAGRPKGPWFKWKRGALTLDTVLMYAQRGHGKRSSFYSDYTFGAWRGERTGAGRQGLFRLHRRGVAAARPLGAQQHHAALRTGARGGARDRPRGRLRQRASLDPPQIRAWRCASRASTASAGTSPSARPIPSRRWRSCSPDSLRPPCVFARFGRQPVPGRNASTRRLIKIIARREKGAHFAVAAGRAARTAICRHDSTDLGFPAIHPKEPIRSDRATDFSLRDGKFAL